MDLELLGICKCLTCFQQQYQIMKMTKSEVEPVHSWVFTAHLCSSQTFPEVYFVVLARDYPGVRTFAVSADGNVRVKAETQE